VHRKGEPNQFPLASRKVTDVSRSSRYDFIAGEKQTLHCDEGGRLSRDLFALYWDRYRKKTTNQYRILKREGFSPPEREKAGGCLPV